MSGKVIRNTRRKIVAIKKGEPVRTTHNHHPQGKDGYAPGSTPKTMTAADIKNAKR